MNVAKKCFTGPTYPVMKEIYIGSRNAVFSFPQSEFLCSQNVATLWHKRSIHSLRPNSMKEIFYDTPN